jgi:hypothetical protein
MLPDYEAVTPSEQQLERWAFEEGRLMDGAPRLEEAFAFSAADVVRDPSRALRALRTDGFARIDGCLGRSSATSLLAHVNEALAGALHASRVNPDADAAYFGDILVRAHRHDLKLSLQAPPVRAALKEAALSLRPLVAGMLADENAELFELAALVSDPGAPRQPIHPDTPFVANEGPLIVTAFLALQDIDESMGPTTFVPGTHTAAAHRAYSSSANGAAAKVALLSNTPNRRGLLLAGDATLFDSRLLHCGGANHSLRRRVLFYFSFRRRAAKAPVPPGTLSHNLSGRHTLRTI